MKRFIVLFSIVAMFSVTAYGNNTSAKEPCGQELESPAKTQQEYVVLYEHIQTIDLGVSVQMFPPIAMKWKVGGPVLFMEYTIRFKSTDSGTKMVISCDLVKNL